MTDLEQQLTDHLRRRAAAATPRYDLEGIEQHTDLASLVDLDRRRSRSRTIRLVVIAACLLAVIALAAVVMADRQSVDTVPPSESPATESSTTTSEAGGPTTLATADEVEITGIMGLGGKTLNVDAVEQNGEVTGEFRVNNLVVTLQCAEYNAFGDLILGGEVTADPDSQSLAPAPSVIGFEGVDVAVGDLLALLIREGDSAPTTGSPTPDRVSIYANDSAGSCTELVDGAAQRPTDGGFFDYVGGHIETNLVLLSGTPTCEEWTERKVTMDDVAPGCRDGDVLAETVAFDCIDNRVLYQNDRVWGYVGEPAHAHEDGAEMVAPDAERDACGIN